MTNIGRLRSVLRIEPEPTISRPVKPEGGAANGVPSCPAAVTDASGVQVGGRVGATGGRVGLAFCVAGPVPTTRIAWTAVGGIVADDAAEIEAIVGVGGGAPPPLDRAKKAMRGLGRIFKGVAPVVSVVEKIGKLIGIA